jgi:hypothetical protein
MKFEEQRAEMVFHYLDKFPDPVGHYIRNLIKDMLFRDNILNEFAFKKLIGKRAVELQSDYGGYPFEPQEIWLERCRQAKQQLIDYLFAVNYSLDYLKQVIVDHSAEIEAEFNVTLDLDYSFNVDVEKSSTKVLIKKLDYYESLSGEEKARRQPEMRELKIVLLRRLITDIPEQVRIAENFLSMTDLREIYERKIGTGKVGGKSTGMLLAYRIMHYAHEEDPYNYREFVKIPESYYLGDEVCIQYLDFNGLLTYRNQKFKLNEIIEREYEDIRDKIMAGRFQESIWSQFRLLLEKLGNKPIIVRSSSLLEDNIGFSFAGKYDSYFLGNQGTQRENLEAFVLAIKKIYAGVFSPDAIVYRKRSKMQYDYESMAILIQEVVGRRVGRYVFPDVAGVIFSENPYIWSRKIRKEDGMIRMVYGLGTRAVDRVGEDYPRMVSLTAPELRPESQADIFRYSQKYVDVIDLEKNDLVTVTLDEITRECPDAANPFIHSVKTEDMVRQAVTILDFDQSPPVITFDKLLAKTRFARIISGVIDKIKRFYGHELDIEFAGEVGRDGTFRINLLQCRPQSTWQVEEPVMVPEVPEDAVIFSCECEVPHCRIENIEYIIYVDPEGYDRLTRVSDRYEVARIIGRINREMEGRIAILMGPGRWGSNNINLGVPVKYNEINNFRLLGEIAREKSGIVPEVSFGTHFFQDLIEAGIYYIPIYPDDDRVIFNDKFFRHTPNIFSSLVDGSIYLRFHKVIRVLQFRSPDKAHIFLDGRTEAGKCFIAEESTVRTGAN